MTCPRCGSDTPKHDILVTIDKFVKYMIMVWLVLGVISSIHIIMEVM